MVFHGNELSLGIIFGAWLVWVGLGSFLAGRGRGAGAPGGPGALLLLIAAVIPFVLVATVLVIREVRRFFPVPPGAYLSISDMTISVFLLVAPAALLLGALFVLLARAWRQHLATESTLGAGRTYMVEALGNAAGGILFSLFLVHHLNSLHTVMMAGLVMTIATIPVARARSTGAMVVLAITTAGAVILFPFLQNLDHVSHQRRWQLFSPDHQLVARHQSRYGDIVVSRRDDQYSFFQSGNFVFSVAPEGSSLEAEEAVLRAHLALVQHPGPERVLLMGGGMTGMLQEILLHPVQHVDYVELDPVLTEAALPFLPRETREALRDQRVTRAHGDGRLFLQSRQQSYDLIIVDIPDPATAVLNRFYTEEFFRLSAERLSSQGVLVVTVRSTADLRGRAVANRNATIYHTMARVFPEVLPAGERTLFLFGAMQEGVVSASPPVLQRRFIERGVPLDSFSLRQFDLFFLEEPLLRTNWILRHHGRLRDAHLNAPEGAPLFPPSLEEQRAMEADLPPVQQQYFLNTDTRPIGYIHTLAHWSGLTRGGAAGAGGTGSTMILSLLRVRPWWLFPVLAVPVGVALILPRSSGSRRRFAVLFAVFTTGLSMMSLQVALLFTFQNVYGYVYEMVGLVVAAFMAGLAAGAYLAQRFVPDPADIRVLRAVQLLITVSSAVFAFLLPRVAALGGSWVVLPLFLGVSVLAGMLNGFDFLPANACYHAGIRTGPGASGTQEQAAGMIYGTELFGACVGAVLAGVLVAPVFGIAAACLLAAFCNGAAWCILRA